MDIVKMFEGAGWERVAVTANEFGYHGFHFWHALEQDDLDYAVKTCKPNHFTDPQGWRMVSIMPMYQGTASEFWYATSGIRGNICRYRGRNVYTIELAKIYTSGHTAESVAAEFIKMYQNREYMKLS